MTEQKTETAAPAAPEPSNFEQAIADMAADQFDRVAGIVSAEASRRADQTANVAGMNDREFQELKDRLCK